MAEPAQQRMTVGEFLAWAQHQPGRYELHGGIATGMSPERNRHALVVKLDTAIELRRAVLAAEVGCRVFPDGTEKTVVHHARTGPETFASTIVTEGRLALDPPGIEVDVGAFFASV